MQGFFIAASGTTGHHFGHQLGLMGSAASPEKYFAPSLDCRITT